MVLRTACLQAEAWRQQFANPQPLVMSVNLSARRVQDLTLIDDVSAALEASGFPASLLKRGITETAAMGAGVATVEVLQALKDLGVRIAIGDFGTGYSSLAYLT